MTEDPETELEITRPTTRGECRGGIRPCPWVSCRHHLLLDVGRPNRPSPSSNRLRAPSLQRSGVRALKRDADEAAVEAWTEAAADHLLEMPETCALDVAERCSVDDSRGDRVASTLREIGDALGITREGARLEINKAIEAGRKSPESAELEPFTRPAVRLVVLADGCSRR